MNTATATLLPTLVDSSAGPDSTEEQSGVRPCAAVTPRVLMAVNDTDPSPIYASVRIHSAPCEMRRSYHVGTRHAGAILPAPCWQVEMRSDGVPTNVIYEVADWLVEQTL